MSITWGSTVNSCGKAGIETSTSSSNTAVSVTATFYFATKYQVSDSSNTNKYGWSTSASTSLGSKSIKHTSSTAWSSSNQTKIGSKSTSFERKTSAYTAHVAYSISGIEYVGSTCSCSKSITIPALPSYTVSYNANGGSNAPSSQTKYYGKSLTLSTTQPTRSGYTFKGWATSANATTTSYSSGATYSSNASITLYAYWSKDITLTYNANNGNVSNFATDKKTITNATTSAKFTIINDTPTLDGFEFLGWSSSSEATSATYTSGESITLSSNATLYAVYRKKITLSYSANGGSNAPSSQSQYVYAVNETSTFTLSSAQPTRKGYAFKGWGIATNSKSGYQSGAKVLLYEDKTLYAIWEPLASWESDNVTWVNAGGRWAKGEPWINTNGRWNKGNLLCKVNRGED